MISAVYINIKKWLQMYGADVLDYFIQPDHIDELDPRKRYDNFDVQYNQHVGTSEHFQLYQGVEFPFLAIDITCDNSAKCFSKVYVNFSVYYSPVTPPTGKVCIENTPEGKLEYREEVHCQLKNMLVHQVKTPRGIQRKTFAQDVASLDGWYLPIRVQVQDIGCPEDFSNELVDEVEMFSFPATLSIFTCL